jgi:hypothetical protein
MRTVLKDEKMDEELGTSRSCFQYSPLVHLICTLARSCESCHIARPRAATNYLQLRITTTRRNRAPAEKAALRTGPRRSLPS